MTFEEVYATLPGNGWLSKEEARLLWEAVNRTEGSILEVGCYQGRSTVLLAATKRTVYTVDPFAGFDSDDADGSRTLAAFQRNLVANGLTYFILSGAAPSVSNNTLPGVVDVYLCIQRIEDWESRLVSLAYLDGDHTYLGTKAQIEKALACGAGVIAVHDVNDSGGGIEVKRACLELLGPWQERAGRLAVWYLRRKEGS